MSKTWFVRSNASSAGLIERNFEFSFLSFVLHLSRLATLLAGLFKVGGRTMSRPATHIILVLIFGSFLAPVHALRAESSGTTRTRVAKLGEYLAAAWTD